jgi:hypothetical protein
LFFGVILCVLSLVSLSLSLSLVCLSCVHDFLFQLFMLVL